MEQRPAGEFGAWLDTFNAAIREGAMDVPCDGCVACCSSGQLIPVAPDDHDALAHLPDDALVPMPGQPEVLVLRHAPDGRCAQLSDEGCVVYEHRPRACRTYDCRIFPAAGIRPDQPLIAEAALRWRFTHASADEQQRHSDVRTAAIVLGFPGGLSAPASPTEHALAAIASADELAG
jgi:Fe-S-cluster containining protein